MNVKYEYVFDDKRVRTNISFTRQLTYLRVIMFYQLFSDPKNPILSEFFFLPSPLPFLTIALAYLLFVLKLGPTLMQNREPFQLKKTIIVYNFLQIVLNCVIFLQVLPSLGVVCTPVSTPSTPIGKICIKLHYCYFLLKLLDLLDTVFFVLRKKQNQISFLHVYHHVGMYIFTWITLIYFPGGQVMYAIFCNTFVHAVMYGYYLYTCFSAVDVRWKKYVTQLQILQDVLLLGSCVIPIVNPNCSYPKDWLAFLGLNGLFNTFLFIKFYQKSYLKMSEKDAEKEKM